LIACSDFFINLSSAGALPPPLYPCRLCLKTNPKNKNPPVNLTGGFLYHLENLFSNRHFSAADLIPIIKPDHINPEFGGGSAFAFICRQALPANQLYLK
jgi:hypothetical protein